MKALLYVFIIIPITVFSQTSSNLQTLANKSYIQGDFYTAAKLYEQLEDSSYKLDDNTKPYMPAALHDKTISKEKNTEIIYKIAVSYYQLHDYTKAQQWFERIKDKDTIADLYYAICLRANGKYEDAEKELNLFLLKDSSDNSYTRQAQNELKNLQFIIEQSTNKTTPNFIVHKIYDVTETSDYALSVNDKNIIITSTRIDSAAAQSNQNPFLNQLYTATIKDKMLEVSGKLNIETENNIHQGIACFTPDGNKLFFTRWFKSNTDTIAAIYVTEKKNNQWLKPVKLNNNVNVDGYKSIQPFITADGKYILFSSDKPGGFGKYDLWYAPLNNNYEPGNAVNLGNGINTNGNDETPFYHTASSTLLFASDARVGMGGFDIYESKGNFIQWDTVRNLGASINSNKDDLYFYCSNNDSLWSNAYLSSDRASECCLQLFAVEYIKPATLPLAIVTDTTTFDTAKNKPSVTVNDSITEEENNMYATTIYFKFNSASLTDSARVILDSLSKLLQTKTSLIVDIAGYTDGFGSTSYNINLSQKRTEACNNYLVRKGVNAEQLHIHAYGKCCPVAAEKLPSGKDNPSGRQKNRRAELKITIGIK